MKEKTDITFHEILVVFDRDPEIMVYETMPTQLAWIASPKNTLNNQGAIFSASSIVEGVFFCRVFHLRFMSLFCGGGLKITF